MKKPPLRTTIIFACVFLAFAATGLFLYKFIDVLILNMTVKEPRDKCQADMRVLAQAINSYHQKYGEYPQWDTGANSVNRLKRISSLSLTTGSFQTFYNQYLARKEVKYEFGSMNNGLPIDPFGFGNMTYAYYSTRNHFYLWSPGPTRKYDILLRDMRNIEPDLALTTGTEGPTPKSLLPLEYDPTNGIYSRGDVLLTH